MMSCKLKNMTYFLIISGIIGKDVEGKLFSNKKIYQLNNAWDVL